MELKAELLFIVGNFLSIVESQPWFHDYQFNSFFDDSGFYGHSFDYVSPTIRDFNLHPTIGDFNLHPYTSLLSSSGHTLILEKIFESQVEAYSIIAELERNLPCHLRSLTSCISDRPKRLYFSDYPHVKSLLLLQWKRLRNNLNRHTLGSLRVDSPFNRP